MQKPRLVFIGWGAVNSRVGALLKQRETPIEIAGIATVNTPRARAEIPSEIPFLGSSDDLGSVKPDLVIEAAGRAAITQWAPAALAVASAMVIASTSAFSDDGVLAWLCDLAERNGRRILVPSGAIGGIDALASAAVLGLHDVLHQIIKPPLAWADTAAEQVLSLKILQDRVDILRGYCSRGLHHLSPECKCHCSHLARCRWNRSHPS